MSENIRYKAGKNSIITLEPKGITNEAEQKYVNSSHAKYRTDKALVIDIQNFRTGKTMDSDASLYDRKFVYKKGELIEIDNYNTDLNETCTTGIHYFKNKKSAVEWYRYINDDYSKYVWLTFQLLCEIQKR
jgi:Family of unknown function (DUF5758)